MYNLQYSRTSCAYKCPNGHVNVGGSLLATIEALSISSTCGHQLPEQFQILIVLFLSWNCHYVFLFFLFLLLVDSLLQCNAAAALPSLCIPIPHTNNTTFLCFFCETNEIEIPQHFSLVCNRRKRKTTTKLINNYFFKTRSSINTIFRIFPKISSKPSSAYNFS